MLGKAAESVWDNERGGDRRRAGRGGRATERQLTGFYEAAAVVEKDAH